MSSMCILTLLPEPATRLTSGIGITMIKDKEICNSQLIGLKEHKTIKTYCRVQSLLMVIATEAYYRG